MLETEVKKTAKNEKTTQTKKTVKASAKPALESTESAAKSKKSPTAAKKPSATKTQTTKAKAKKNEPESAPRAPKKTPSAKKQPLVSQTAPLKVLFAASEAQPFMASGGLADIAGSLPKALRSKQIDCRVVLPLYSDMKPEQRKKLHYLTCFDVSLGWRNQYCGIFLAVEDGVTYYFIDNEYYFRRVGIYGFFDDAERFAFFSRAIVEMLRHIDFMPDVLHANDWQTALAPVYLNLQYRSFKGFEKIKTVFTIHNIQYQGKFGNEILEDVLGLDTKVSRILEYDGCINFMKAAIEMCDRVTTVSPSYAEEIMDPWFSHGLDSFLQARRYKLTGILNGLDTDAYNPATDTMIYENFSVDAPENKAENKAKLLEALSLSPLEQIPLIGVVTRLAAHKGLDLIKYVFEDMIKLGTQFVILGSGEYMYEEFFRLMQDKYPRNVRFIVGFIPELAHKIYAGADMFLMPSKSEPCGLAQMIAARYGTAPIVRETGGLKDTINDFGSENGNGFTFKTYNAHDMLAAVERARDCYLSTASWQALQKAAMSSDFTWGKSAKEYIDLYQSM